MWEHNMNERLQLHDDINSGKVDIKDVSLEALEMLRTDFEMEYQPSLRFYVRVSYELRRREVEGATKRIDTDFFKVKP
jgi:hypothetical protein